MISHPCQQLVVIVTPIINAIEIIGVESASLPPVVNLGSTAVTVTLPSNSVSLTGTGNDPDGGAVTLEWTTTKWVQIQHHYQERPRQL